MSQKVVGIIGGSGVYSLDGMTAVEQVQLQTPFGSPSDAYTVGRLGDTKLVFLPRHGRGHRLSPSEINYRANVHGMKQLGAEWILSVSAVGSMREEIHPGDIVIPDQFFDRTKGVRASTFFEDGIVAHVGFADPVCGALAGVLYESAKAVGAKAHKGGTYVVMEGPQFSTRAESNIYRKWGVDVIGMTNLPEAKLAREAECCYATVALATDYDCWHDGHDAVTVDSVLQIIKQNVATAKALLAHAVSRVPARTCGCKSALAGAIMTAPDAIPDRTRERVELLAGKYLPRGQASR
jgi:5'-methylthioadenosine phosphorylase